MLTIKYYNWKSGRIIDRRRQYKRFLNNYII
jgi:hypothetical protein